MTNAEVLKDFEKHHLFLSPTDFVTMAFFQKFAERPYVKGLEVGCNEEFASHLLLSKGYDISGLDVRPFSYKRKTKTPFPFYAESLFETSLKSKSFDYVFSLSAIEHFGLDYYGEGFDAEGDQKAFRIIHSLLKRRGHFYVTLPVGTSLICKEWRRYSREDLKNLLKVVSWKELSRGIYMSKYKMSGGQSSDILEVAEDEAFAYDGEGCPHEIILKLQKS